MDVQWRGQSELWWAVPKLSCPRVEQGGTRRSQFPKFLFLNTDNSLPTARAEELAALGSTVSCWKQQHCLCLVLWSGNLCCCRAGLGWGL